MASGTYAMNGGLTYISLTVSDFNILVPFGPTPSFIKTDKIVKKSLDVDTE